MRPVILSRDSAALSEAGYDIGKSTHVFCISTSLFFFCWHFWVGPTQHTIWWMMSLVTGFVTLCLNGSKQFLPFMFFNSILTVLLFYLFYLLRHLHISITSPLWIIALFKNSALNFFLNGLKTSHKERAQSVDWGAVQIFKLLFSLWFFLFPAGCPSLYPLFFNVLTCISRGLLFSLETFLLNSKCKAKHKNI